MSCIDPFSSPQSLPSRQSLILNSAACTNRPWLIYAPISPRLNATSVVVPLRANDLVVLDGCFDTPASLCATYCSLASYLASERQLAIWEIGLSLVGLLILLATLIVLSALRQLPGGRLAAVHRQLLWAYCAYYLCRSGRLLSWPAIRCLGRSASLSLDALFELLETLAYAGLFASFLAQSACLRLRLGRRHKPACQSPPRRKRQPLVELLSLAWPLPVAVAIAHLACRTLAAGQIGGLHAYAALYRPEPVSYYTAAVRLPLASAHLVSMLLGIESLRLSLPPRTQGCPGPARWARSLALISALTGAYLMLDLLPPGLAPSWLRPLQLAGHLLQSLLVTLPMFWLNRRQRRSARYRIRRGVAGAPGSRRQLLTARLEVAAAAVSGCRLVSFLQAASPDERLDHIDCEIDS